MEETIKNFDIISNLIHLKRHNSDNIINVKNNFKFVY